MDQFKTQQAIRQNASEISDYLSDLRQWGNEMEKKEKKAKEDEGKNAKNNNKNNKNNNDLPPIRNSAQAAAQFKENVKC